MYLQPDDKETQLTYSSAHQPLPFRASKAHQIIARNMTAVDIHSASAISSESSKEGTIMTQENMTGQDDEVHTPYDPMSLNEDIVRVESASDHSSAMDIDPDSDHEPAKQDALVEEILMAVEPKTDAPAVQAPPVQTMVTTDWHAYYSTANKARRSVTKTHNRNPSISATMELPWAVDNTCSSPQASHKLNRSLSIPPPPKAAEMNFNGATDSHSSSDIRTANSSPKLHPLMTKVPPTSPAPYAHSSTRQAPSPYSSTSSSQSQQPHNHSLTSPPGYTQNTHASFSTIQTNTTSNTANTSHPSTPTTTSISLSRPSSSYSSYSPTDKSAPPILLYDTNTSPFYSNSYSGADYNNSLFSPTFSFTGPATPKTPASASRRGILDNDPAIYLRPDGENPDDDGSIWDTATKWAKLASKKLSMGAPDRHSGSARGGGIGIGQSEFSVSSGLWRMVGGLGEDRKDAY